MSIEHIDFFFDFQLNLKMYHWSTCIYSRHVASDKLGEKLLENIDRFVELYIGRYSRPKMSKKHNISYSIISDKDMVGYLKGKRDYLEKLALTDDLANVRDELVENINQTLYLFTLE